MADHPPTYSQQDPVDSQIFHDQSQPQILIVPALDAVNFQKGFLGAEGERAAVEGEIQIKGVNMERWARITISLRSFESAYQNDIELSVVEVELYSWDGSQGRFPSSIPFSIPLLPDTPQSLQTPHSALGHTLTATLHPAAGQSTPPVSKSLNISTRRYLSHSHTLPSSPETHTLEDPTLVEVQLPRDSFTSVETIPLYITVPPPPMELVVDQGLRLRNIRAELVRVVKVKREHFEDSEPGADEEVAIEEPEHNLSGPSLAESSHVFDDHRLPSSSKVPLSPLFLGSSYRTIVARSGASCRFHSSRPIQLRFVLHQNSSGTPSDSRTNIDRMDSDLDSGLITQSTLLHSVSFHIKVHVSFVDTSSQTERISTMIIPITIVPPHAPLPEVSQAIDDAYQKKHDRPPARTVREPESDPSIPHYSEGEAGPSMLSSGAPPPFEERDAPPPFFVSAFEASSSSRLPTFQESEREIILPDAEDILDELAAASSIPGEGTIFGFPPVEQFDGHSEDMQRSSTPPPTLEMASRDTDLTALTDQPSHVAIEALNMVLEQHEEHSRGEEQPPPPPPMDDPSDPPPSIDSDFRSPIVIRQPSPSPSTSPPLFQSDSALRVNTSPPPTVPQETSAPQGTAPPPYLTPDTHRANDMQNDQVIRPPPYVD
ncbi:hypothetical protein NLJ89_g539 [Agrocybe chaxingu]|uniref:Uncharacterized protein n=1 Tax=Agrocybe chaxingu TaxID=84603 RepID=A0A9W8N1Q5_9AGAR|nr:hypothetical protein NLJ89_g539 [Agrocybe chaxingu]